MSKYVFTPLTSLEGVDFDAFWAEGSASILEKFGPFIPDGEDPFEYVKGLYSGWLSAPDGLTFLVTDDQGTQLMLYNGRIVDTCFHVGMLLVRPNPDETKSYYYTPQFQKEREDFFISQGFTEFSISVAGAFNYIESYMKQAYTVINEELLPSGLTRVTVRLNNS